MRSILLLFLGDATRDRRVQNFARYFTEQGWSVEVIAIQLTVASRPSKIFRVSSKNSECSSCEANGCCFRLRSLFSFLSRMDETLGQSEGSHV